MTKLWRTLIIDDEELARTRLKRLLAGFNGFFEVVGEAVDGNHALEMIELYKPDLVFLDVQMPGKNVFDMLAAISHKPFVVFCTAYDHYALQAFESYSIDYLIKPVEEGRLKQTIAKLNKINMQADSSLLKVIDAIRQMETKKVPTSVPHKTGDKTILVKLEQVVYFEADDKYVNFFNAEGNQFFSDQTLKILEDKLPEHFLRVSKSVILNTHFVNEMHRYFRGKVVFVMNDIKKTKIISGSFYAEKIKKTFNL